MGISYNTKPVLDDLVFYADMGNPKSFKGKATTNILDGGADARNGKTQYTGISNHTHGGGVISSSYTGDLRRAGRPHVLEIKSNNTLGYTGAAWQMNTNAVVNNYYTLTLDIYYDLPSQANGFEENAIVVYGNGYKVPDSSSYAANTSITKTYIGDGWWRYAFTWQATYAGANYIRCNFSTYDTEDFRVFIDNIQIEEGQISSHFTDSSRSVNDVVLPIIGSTTTNASSMGYKADRTGFFDRVYGPSTLFTGWGSGYETIRGLTIEAWLKADALYSNHMWLDAGESNGTNQRCYSAINTSTYDGLGHQASAWSSSGTPDTNWHHQALVWDNGTIRVFDNGEQIRTKSYTNYTLFGDIQFGGRTTYPFGGNIDIMKIYDAPLGNDKIRQNFEAHRGRFGL